MSTVKENLSLYEALRLYPLVWVQTEPLIGLQTALEELPKIDGMNGKTIHAWNASTGWNQDVAKVELGRVNLEKVRVWGDKAKQPAVAEMELQEALLKSDALIVDANYLRLGAHIQAACLRVQADNRRVVFVATHEPPPDFLPDYLRSVEINYTPENLKEDVKSITKQESRTYREDLTAPLAGLRGFRATSTLRESIIRTEKGDELPYLYNARKDALYRDTGQVVSLVDAQRDFGSLVGLSRAKKLFKALIAAVNKGELVKGALLFGIPGTGKTSLAEAVAGEAKLPLYIVHMGASFGSLVGESERRTQTALRGLRNSPRGVVLFDEIEKSLSGSSKNAGRGDAGTATRVGEYYLNYLANPTALDGYHLVIGTSNDPDALPPEFTRAGRWDVLFWFGFPKNPSLLVVLEMYRKMYKLHKNFGNEADLSDLTPAEIESVCRIANRLETDSWPEAVQYVPRLKEFRADEIEKLKTESLKKAVSADDDEPVKNSRGKIR